MRENELAGSWKQKNGGSVLHLHPDKTAVCEGHTRQGEIIRERATWEYIDERHWNLVFNVEVEPGGLIEINEYEVVSFTAARMEVTLFDNEFPVVYERVTG